jgi:aryl-alcohol dehydrogenase-like predicted oxidoreductase
MHYRTLGRTGWSVSEIGTGLWQVGGAWKDVDDSEAIRCFNRAIELGCNFFDTAWAYGDGRSERILGEILRAHSNTPLYTASKVPPANRRWPGRKWYTESDSYSYEHILHYTHESLKNIGVEQLGLMQLHTWHDEWVTQDGWQRAAQDLKQSGKIQAFGISINRWEPTNVLKALGTGLIDAVQVIYNIFDSNPEDELFPVCRELNIGVIVRVPLDEGSLAGKMTYESRFPADDWRSIYFIPENLHPTIERVEALRPLIPAGMSMAEMALRFTLCDPAVSTVIVGMSKVPHVEQNIGVSDGQGLPEALLATLRKEHRWVRDGWVFSP